jgi:hypothetical protein
MRLFLNRIYRLYERVPLVHPRHEPQHVHAHEADCHDNVANASLRSCECASDRA